MLKSNFMLARALCAVVVCMLLVLSEANAIPNDIHNVLDRTYVDNSTLTCFLQKAKRT